PIYMEDAYPPLSEEQQGYCRDNFFDQICMRIGLSLLPPIQATEEHIRFEHAHLVQREQPGACRSLLYARVIGDPECVLATAHALSIRISGPHAAALVYIGVAGGTYLAREAAGYRAALDHPAAVICLFFG
ncbi:MAG: hypothetical protein SGCHY_005217, partial [Lobulomycetales sp.]